MIAQEATRMPRGNSFSFVVPCFCVLLWITYVSCDQHDRPLWINDPDIDHVTLDNVDSRFYDYKNEMIDYVIHRGCSYMSVYVRSRYMNHHSYNRFHSPRDVPTSSDSGPCSWEQFIRKMSDMFHIPAEFRDALIDCGQSRSSGLHADTDTMKDGCELSLSSIIGRREVEEEPETAVLKDVDNRKNPSIDGTKLFPSSLRNGVKRRVHEIDLTNDDDVYDDADEIRHVDRRQSVDDQHEGGEPGLSSDHRHHGNDTNHISTQTWRVFDNMVSNRTVPSTFLQSWCHTFSRKIRHKHHLNSVNFRNTSNHWMLDVYRIVNKYRMPKSYAHTLIGCGLKDVLYAFHVPLWQTLAYIIQLH